jgi:hypothetical protein
MNTTLPARPYASRFPLLDLLSPRNRTPLVIASLVLGAVIGWASMRFLAQPLWVAALAAVAILLPVGVMKWRDDATHFGRTLMLLSILLTAQGAHTIEHIVQWVQYNIFMLPARQASGIVSPANAEWVHFIWNTWVLIMVLLLVKGGMRNVWAGLLLGVVIAHSIEHTYTFVRYLQVLGELSQMGITNVTAQGLPGIIGRDGWLARSPLTQGTILCSLPGLTTAIRLDVHFWWNVIEMTLLVLAGHVFLRQHFAKQAQSSQSASQPAPQPVP